MAENQPEWIRKSLTQREEVQGIISRLAGGETGVLGFDESDTGGSWQIQLIVVGEKRVVEKGGM